MFSVLIVENNNFFRQSFGEILKLYLPDVSIEVATNGEDALKIIDRCPPDVVFMDIHLYGKNGLELTREIKSSHPEIFIVILTNYDYSEYRETAYWYGADHFLLKDAISGADVADLIRCVISEKSPVPKEDEWLASVHDWCRAPIGG